MFGKYMDNRRTLEVMLVLIVLAMTALLVLMQGHKMVILNLFYLPVVLSGYFLGRYSAGILAILSAILVTIAVTIDTTGFATYNSPTVVGLVVTVWAGILGLSALLIGTLCDERAAKVDELHAAYVGVVEVLSKYLQSANPRVKARSIRVAELSQMIAKRMRLSRQQTDDIRVGALLYDIGNVEITTELISKAVGTLESAAAPTTGHKHTFHGMELVHSLEPVLSGAIPLLMNQDDDVHDCLAAEEGGTPRDVPLGAKIIRLVRAFDNLTEDSSDGSRMTPQQAVNALRKDASVDYDKETVRVLESCVMDDTGKASKKERHALSV